MEDINEKANKSQTANGDVKVNFYRLDKSKPYKTESEVSKHNNIFLIVLGVLLIAASLIATVVVRKYFKDDFGVQLFPLVVCVFGIVILVIGILNRVKNNRRYAYEQSILSDCVLTDGQIVDCSCICHSHTDSDNNTSYTYEVSLSYTFYDKSLNARYGRLDKIYLTDPQFYIGQYLMIAFNSQDSLIMREFTLEGSDMQRFFENEAARSDDDFDMLTGAELDVDVTKPIKVLNGSFVFLCGIWLMLGFLVLNIAIVVGVFILDILAFGLVDSDIQDILLLVGFSVTPLILIALLVVFIVSYIKSVQPIKKIMKNNPYFTYGKVFASESTFRGQSRTLKYCYIDKWGDRHTEQLKVGLSMREMQNLDRLFVIAYDAYGNSAVLTDCSINNC